MSKNFVARRDWDEWALHHGLKIVWDRDDLAAFLADGRVANILKRIHAEERLGNTIAFAEMILERQLSESETVGFGVRVPELGYGPWTFFDLARYADGLHRIEDPRLVPTTIDSNQAYRARGTLAL